MKNIFSSVVFSFLLLISTTVNAAEKEIDALTRVIDTSAAQVNYEEINKEITSVEENIKGQQVSSKTMNKYIKRLSIIQSQLNDAKTQKETELKFVEKRIEALGEEPKDGEEEPFLIASSRKEFKAEQSSIKEKLAWADITLAKIDELESLMLNTHNKELLDNLLDRRDPLIYPSNLIHGTVLFVEFFFDMIKSPLDWYHDLTSAEHKKFSSSSNALVLIVLFSLWFGIFVRSFIMKKMGYKSDVERPRYAARFAAAFFVAIARGVIPAIIIGVFIVFIRENELVKSGFFSLVLNSILYYLLYIFIARAVFRVTFAPYNEKWRLVNVGNYKAKKLNSAFLFTVVVLGLGSCVLHIATQASYPLDLIYYIKTVLSGLKGLCIVLVIKRFLYSEPVEVLDADREYLETEEEEEQEDQELTPEFKIVFAAFLIAASIFAIGIFGYPNLSSFIFNRFIFSCLLIGAFLILRKSLTEVVQRVLFLSVFGRTFRTRKRLVSKINFWFGLIVDPVLFLGGLFILLSAWGVSTDLLLQSSKKLFLGFTIAGIKISLFSVFLGVVSFFVSMAVFRAVRKRFLHKVLEKMEIEEGTRYSLLSGFGFVGFIASAIIAIIVMGGNLTNLALIAGALSFGVGLGLQNIVNNFVSGTILLFERPIKVGDWVIINGQEGIVKQINIRATELETFQKANVIIPNADILSTSVINMTHKDKWGRVDVAVGVAYGTDAEKVKDILQEIAENNKKLIKKPAPYVVFMAFADSTINFEVRGFTADVGNKLTIASELRSEIYRRFNQEKIDIALPQRVVHIAPESRDLFKRK